MSTKENNSEVAVDKVTENNEKAGGDAKAEVKGTKRPAEEKTEDPKKHKKEENGDEEEDIEDEEDVEGEEEDEEDELQGEDDDLDEAEEEEEEEEGEGEEGEVKMTKERKCVMLRDTDFSDWKSDMLLTFPATEQA